MAACLLCASHFMSFDARAEKVKAVSGLSGGQDTESKKWLALSPSQADHVATQHLLSILRPVGKFMQDNSRNVEGMTFVTLPYATTYPYVCRQDRVILRYQHQGKFDGKGKWLADERRPAGVEAQATFHIGQLPVPGFIPGTHYPVPLCDAQHPATSAGWITGPSAKDVILAANLFRMAEDDVKAGRFAPGPCDPHGTLTCRERLLSLDDPSKIESVQPCANGNADRVCYIVSFDALDVTITGKISRDDVEAITPAAITSIRLDDVTTIME
jgi:hypothetical protein